MNIISHKQDKVWYNKQKKKTITSKFKFEECKQDYHQQLYTKRVWKKSDLEREREDYGVVGREKRLMWQCSQVAVVVLAGNGVAGSGWWQWWSLLVELLATVGYGRKKRRALDEIIMRKKLSCVSHLGKTYYN